MLKTSYTRGGVIKTRITAQGGDSHTANRFSDQNFQLNLPLAAWS
jgi:hypothetical protein